MRRTLPLSRTETSRCPANSLPKQRSSKCCRRMNNASLEPSIRVRAHACAQSNSSEGIRQGANPAAIAHEPERPWRKQCNQHCHLKELKNEVKQNIQRPRGLLFN